MIRGIRLVIVISLVALLWGCTSGNRKNNAAGGISWNAPSGWLNGPAQQMRVKTYIIRPADNDRDKAECAVSYFGNGMGGDKQSNLERWANQFEQGGQAQISEMEIINLRATIIELGGTYRISSGSMSQASEKKPGYKLLGAIIEAPEGLVFFKLVGPRKIVENAKHDFLEMINSARISGT